MEDDLLLALSDDSSDEIAGEEFSSFTTKDIAAVQNKWAGMIDSINKYSNSSDNDNPHFIENSDYDKLLLPGR